MLNRIILIGRLVADPELKFVSGDLPVGKFRIAVDRNFKNQKGEVETDFINIVVWRQQAEFVCKHLQKGRLVAVDGRLQVRQYQDENNQKRSISEVVAERVQFLDRPRGEGGSASSEEGHYPPPPPEEPGEHIKDDLPF